MMGSRRDKIRYNLMPRGKALYEDKNRFGTRMLEKMGWTEGKGLGANENGIQEFIRIKYKNDAVGIGFEDRDDQWTQHEEYFNGLLKSLNSSNNSEDDIEDNEQKAYAKEDIPKNVGFGFENNDSIKNEKLKVDLSGESLEEKSKKSRVRVHYKKFTRGKDIAQYSEKDLANIFGKKTLNNSENKNENVLMYGVITRNSEKLFQNYLKQGKKENCKEYGITINNDENDCNVSKRKSKKSHERDCNEIENESNENEKNMNGIENVIREEEEIPETKEKKEESTIHFANEDGEHLNQTEISLNSLHEKKQKNNYGGCSESPRIQNISSSSLCNEMESEATVDVNCSDDVLMESCEKMKNKVNIDDENIQQISNAFTTQSNEAKYSNKEVKFEKNQFKMINETRLNTQEINEKCPSKTELEIKQESKEKSGYGLCDSFYTNSFVLEKFRYVALDKFKGSNIEHIVGYGLNDEFVIKVDPQTNDTLRILNMWANVENNIKYEMKEAEKKSTYGKVKKNRHRRKKIFTKI